MSQSEQAAQDQQIQQLPTEGLSTSQPEAVKQPLQWKDYLYTQSDEQFDSISREDINQLNLIQYKIALYPIAMFLGLTGLKKATEYLSIPHLLRNPLIQPNMNAQRGKHFRTFLGKNIILLACTTSLIGGYAVYEVNKYYMYLKYKNLVNVYLDACDRDYLKTLKLQGQQVDLVIGQNRARNIQE